MEREAFDQWVILELMGHRRLAGHLTEQEIGGASFLRLDVPADPQRTQFYSAAAVYAIHPVTEETARLCARKWTYEPVGAWDARRLLLAPETEEPMDGQGYQGGGPF